MKKWLRKWVFSDELDAVAQMQEDGAAELKRAEELRREAFDARQDALADISIVDLVREQLAGFNPRLLDVDDELVEMMDGEDAVDSFLAEAKKLHDNTALPKILDHITRKQIMESTVEALTLETINFGRGSLNGVTLVREEVERLHTAFVLRHAPKEEFDAHEAL